jgi:ankyrin repeat protein
LDLVKYLISKGANVNLKAKDGTSALSLTIKEKNDEIIKILKDKGAKE